MKIKKNCTRKIFKIEEKDKRRIFKIKGKGKNLKAVEVLYNAKILKFFLNYLQTCKSDFIKYNNLEENLEERNSYRENVKAAYELFNKDNIEEMLFDMNRLTKSYLEEIQELNKEAAEKGEESEQR